MKKPQPIKTTAKVAPKTIEVSPEVDSKDYSQKYIWAVLILTFIVYSFGFGNGFTNWDDPVYINSVMIEPLKNLKKIVTMVCAANYHPVTMLSLVVNMVLFGREPWSFIVTNSLIHVANTYLVFVFIQKLLEINNPLKSTKAALYIALSTALFFGIHPMHVESVVWIAERKDVLYTLFFLLALVKYCDFILTNNNKYYWLTLLFFVLSCLSKAMAVILPLVLILIDYWHGKSPLDIKNHINKLVFFAFSLLIGLITLDVQAGGDFHGFLVKEGFNAMNPNWSFFQKLKYAGYGMSIYWLKLFFPFGLKNEYPYPYYNNINYLEHTLGFLAFVAISGFIGYLIFGKKNKVIAFGAGFFAATIILVSQMVSVGNMILAERYTYIPYIGLFFVLFYYIFKKYHTNKNLIYITFGVSLIYSVLSVKQIFTWKSSLTLWENAYNKGMRDFGTLMNLADLENNKAGYDKMLLYCNEAMDLKLSSPKFARFVGDYHYNHTKDYAKALEYYDKALATPNIHSKKDDADEKLKCYFYKGMIYQLQGKIVKADSSFEMAVNQKTLPRNKAEVLRFRSNIRVNNKMYKEAIEDLNYLVDKGVASDTVYNDRAIANFQLGNLNGAVADLKKALEINPENPDAKSNLVKLKPFIKP